MYTPEQYEDMADRCAHADFTTLASMLRQAAQMMREQDAGQQAPSAEPTAPPPSVPSAQQPEPRRFIDNGDGTVTDATTGLMWSKGTIGDWETMCAELLRLAEYEGVACQFAVEKAEQRRRAEAAESERDSLRAKLAEAEQERDEWRRKVEEART